MKMIELRCPIRFWTYDWDSDETIKFDISEYPFDLIEIILLGAVEKYNQHLSPLKGLAEYMNAIPKLLTAKPTIRYVDGEFMGVCECYISEDLTPEEEKELISELECQYSDGWGEGFEQFDIPIDGHKHFHVSYWNPQDPGWKIELIDPRKEFSRVLRETANILREYTQLLGKEDFK